MVYYELIEIAIDTTSLGEIIINIVIKHYGLPESIVGDRDSLFT